MSARFIVVVGIGAISTYLLMWLLLRPLGGSLSRRFRMVLATFSGGITIASSVLAMRVSRSGPPITPPSTITTNIGNLVVDVTGPAADAGEEEFRPVSVEAIQPVASVADGGGGTMILRDLELVAAAGTRSVIGGMPLDAPPGTVPASIIIRHSILDTAIQIGANVTIEQDVVRRIYGKAADPVLVAANDGRDAHRPVLPQWDINFVDRKTGSEWGDRCWIHLRSGRWGWAKAECDKGLVVARAGGSALHTAQLLYNEGLIATYVGDRDSAASYFRDSLALREHPIVRAALSELLDGGSPSPVSPFSDAGASDAGSAPAAASTR